MKLALGLMSGTSADGVSLTLSSFQGRSFKLLAYETFSYPASLTKEILKGPELRTSELSRLNMKLGHFFAEAALRFIKKNRLPASRISVIGSHGQTVYHGPSDKPRNTYQIGEAAVLAERTGIPVVSDFRVRDVAAGGDGAPLIPFFDDYYFGGGKTRALQNIGGISNVTVVGSSLKPLAFDNGPGNCLMDEVIQKATRHRRSYDKNGQMASEGTILMKLVKQMAAHPYFSRKPPKSTGRELFNHRFLPAELKSESLKDQLATLNFFTAYTLAKSYRELLPSLSEIIVSGGGALNAMLMSHLKDLCAPVPVVTIEKYGLPAQAKEPLAFAFYACRMIEGKTNHLPQITGASRPCVLGKLSPGRN